MANWIDVGGIRLSPTFSQLPPPPSDIPIECTPTTLFSMDAWAAHSNFEQGLIHQHGPKDTEQIQKAKGFEPQRKGGRTADRLPMVNLPEAIDQKSRYPKPSAKQSKKRVFTDMLQSGPKAFRQYSTLSRWDHQLYLSYCGKISRNETLNPREQEDYNQLHAQVQDEQKEYRECKKKMMPICNICESIKAGETDATAHPCNNHRFIHPEVEKTVACQMVRRKLRVRNYPAYYKPNDVPSIDLSSLPTSSTAFTLAPVTEKIAGLGSIPELKMHQNNPWRYVDPTLCPFRIEGKQQTVWTKSQKTPVISCDMNILTQCAKNDAQFAMSSSTFKALALLLVKPDRPFTIPVKVVVEDGKPRILLDKPLVQEKYTCRELNTMFYKHALHADSVTDKTHELESGKDLGEGNNLCYEAFRLGSHCILIRRRIPGMTGSNLLSIMCKMEYYNRGFDLQMDGHRHLEFETMTDAEFLEYYFQMLIRPGSWLQVGRINVFSSSLIRVDRFTYGSLDTYLRGQNLLPQPSTCLAGINTLLSALGNLKEGKYVLRHEAGVPAVSILQECGQAEATFNLHGMGDQAGRTDRETVSFIPLSDEYFEQELKKIPNTFPLPSGLREYSWSRQARKDPGDLANQDTNYNISLFFYNWSPKEVRPIKGKNDFELLENIAAQKAILHPDPMYSPPATSTHQRRRTAQPPPGQAAAPDMPLALPPATEGAEQGTSAGSGAQSQRCSHSRSRSRSRSQSRSPPLTDNELSLGSDDDGMESDAMSELSVYQT